MTTETPSPNPKLRKLENLHVTFWLLKDTSWCQHWIYFGLIIAVPTLALSLYLAWKSRHDLSDFIHNAAVCLWIGANIIWMVGEFFFDDGTRGTRTFYLLNLDFRILPPCSPTPK